MNSALKTNNIKIINSILKIGKLNEYSFCYTFNNKEIFDKILDVIKENNEKELLDIFLNDAIDTKNIYFINKIIENGGKPNIDSLNDAIKTGDIKIIDRIIEIGGKPDEHSIDYAIETNNIEILNKIIQHENKILLSEDTLTKAIETKNTEIILLTIKLGAEPNVNTLSYVFELKNIEIIHFVIKHMLEINEFKDINTPTLKSIHTSIFQRILYLSDIHMIISHFIYIISLNESMFPIIIKYINGNIDNYMDLKISSMNDSDDNYDKNYNINFYTNEIKKYKIIKYKLACNAHNYLGLNALHEILQSVNISKINDKEISQLNKSEICEFLDEKYKSSDVFFSK